MSALEQREQLIQQRQAERYINVVRMIVLAFIGFALLIRVSDPNFRKSSAFAFDFGLFVCAIGYVLAVQYAVSRSFLPKYVPWVTTFLDFALSSMGFVVQWLLPSPNPETLVVSFSWGYAIFFLLVFFSSLRERPELTLASGIFCSLIYSLFVFVLLSKEPYPGFWAEQEFRVGMLLVAGLFSWFHARSLRKAFRSAAASERLRRETDERLKVLALNFPGVLFQTEVEGRTFRIVYVSEGSREMLGLYPQQLLMDAQVFFSRTDQSLHRELWQKVASGPRDARSWQQEFLYESPSGKKQWLRMSVSSHETPGGKIVYNGLLTDVSDQKAAEEALREANQAKSDFMATMSHELRTPLNAILGNADLLSPIAKTDEEKKGFRDILASGETLLGIIDDILFFSRLEAGRLTANIRPVNWRHQVELIVDTFRPAIEAKHLSLNVSIDDDIPPYVWTDVLRLRQILSNLVGNAVKFTAEGSVSISVRWEPTEDFLESLEGRLSVTVRDTGIGISSSDQEKIFEKFVQADQSKSRTYGGMGLGLSISRSLAEMLRGSLTVESEPGLGSSFELTLSVRACKEGDFHAAGKEGENLVTPSVKILLVEDNETNQDVAVRMLKKLGADVDLAVSGFQAIDKAKALFYDIIFMDWQMPGMDGREATSRIRNLPSGQDLVIIALSGHALPGDRELLLASGFDDYLSKPVRMDDFRAAIEKWHSRKSHKMS